MSRYHDLNGGGVYAPPRDEPAGGIESVAGPRSGRGYAAGRRGGSRTGWRPGGPGGPGGPRRNWPAWLGPHPGRSIAAIAVTGVLVIASLAAYVMYRNVYDSIRHENVTAAMLGKRPPAFNGSVNILVIGSDSRAGTHGRYGTGIQGARSDTSMLLHISPDHKHAVMVSFPRDSMVPVLSCLPDGQGHQGQQAAPGQSEMLNATFSAGGAPCLWKTLEQTTGIRINHFAEVDFSGFKSIVNDVGGVKVCLPFAISDPASGMNLPAGVHNVNGAQALAFVRERHVGLGSDLQRIQRQQYFLVSVMQKIKQSNILSDPNQIYHVIHDVARSLTTDSGLTLTTMASMASSMRGLSSGALHFISVPVVPDPTDPTARVDWAQPQAGALFRAISHDTRLPKSHKAHKSSPGKAKPGKSAPPVKPSQVQVEVLDGSGIAGVAGSTAQALSGRGFGVIGTGNAPNFSYTSTVIQYASPSQLPEVDALKAAVGQAQVEQSASVQAGNLNLILGSDFTHLVSKHAKHGSGVGALAKNYGGISGSANICKDSAAFAGPDSPTMFGG